MATNRLNTQGAKFPHKMNKDISIYHSSLLQPIRSLSNEITRENFYQLLLGTTRKVGLTRNTLISELNPHNQIKYLAGKVSQRRPQPHEMTKTIAISIHTCATYRSSLLHHKFLIE